MSDIEPTTNFTRDGAVDVFYLTAMTQGNLSDIVALTTAGPSADLLAVETFELSALGANVDLTGTWTPPADIDLVAWSELGQGGRVVRTVLTSYGYLFPLGHRANIVSVFHRAVALDPRNAVTDPADYPVAYLQAQKSIHVTQSVKAYPAPGQPFGPPYAAAGAGTTDWPFSSVRMVTLASPNIDFNAPIQLGGSQAIWPTIGQGKTDVQWTFLATDAAGHTISFTMPLVFVYGRDTNNGYDGDQFASGSNTALSFTEQLARAYDQLPSINATGPGNQTYSFTGGAPLRLAPEAGVQGGTTHPTLALTLGAATTRTDAGAAAGPPSPASRAALVAAGQPNFYPTIRSARVRLHAADVLTGTTFTDAQPAGDPTAPAGGVRFSYYPPYVRSGILGGRALGHRRLREWARGKRLPQGARSTYAQLPGRQRRRARHPEHRHLRPLGRRRRHRR